VEALQQQGRSFLEPLKFDARTAAGFPNVLLLDAGRQPAPIHVVSAFADAKDRAVKDRAIRSSAPARGSGRRRSRQALHGGRQPLLTMAQCRQIAGEFDGSTDTIDRLLARWRDVVPTLQRHHIVTAARRGAT
jgi:hypothetical protein